MYKWAKSTKQKNKGQAIRREKKKLTYKQQKNLAKDEEMLPFD